MNEAEELAKAEAIGPPQTAIGVMADGSKSLAIRFHAWHLTRDPESDEWFALVLGLDRGFDYGLDMMVKAMCEMRPDASPDAIAQAVAQVVVEAVAEHRAAP